MNASSGQNPDSVIASQMEKQNFPYQIYRYTDLGHEVSIGGPMTMDVFNLFVKQYIIAGKKQYQDITIRDEQYPPTSWSRMSVKDLYKKK